MLVGADTWRGVVRLTIIVIILFRLVSSMRVSSAYPLPSCGHGVDGYPALLPQP